MGRQPKTRRREDEYHPWSTYIKAREEAGRRGDRTIGTELVLLALLTDPAVASAVGTDATHARAVLDELDNEALTAIGMDPLPEVPPRPAQDLQTVPNRPTIKIVLHKHLRLTPSAKRVLSESSRGMRRGHSHPGPQHVLAGILELREPDPAAELLAKLGVQPGVVRDRLATNDDGAEA